MWFSFLFFVMDVCRPTITQSQQHISTSYLWPLALRE